MSSSPETRYHCGLELNVVSNTNSINLWHPPEGWQVTQKTARPVKGGRRKDIKSALPWTFACGSIYQQR